MQQMVIEILTYLIVREITTSKSMSAWAPALFSEVVTGEFDSWLKLRVRELRDAGILPLRIATVLLQYPLWKNEATELANEITGSGIVVILWSDKRYPFLLRQISDFPAILYCLGGCAHFADKQTVTLVGTREPTRHALSKTTQLVYEAVSCGYTTVSGLAAGIDMQVLLETMRCGGNSIACVPQLKQEHYELIARYGSNLLICSEFPIMTGMVPKWRYVARNRILAGLSAQTIVVQAPVRSGTLHTFDFAVMYDRDVYVVFPSEISVEEYGGVIRAQAHFAGMYVLSLYDVFYFAADDYGISQYLAFIARLSSNRIIVPKTDARYLGIVDLRRIIVNSVNGDLRLFEKSVIELLQLGIVLERKGTVQINFSGSDKWPKISLS
jgi:DNA processing protein